VATSGEVLKISIKDDKDSLSFPVIEITGYQFDHAFQIGSYGDRNRRGTLEIYELRGTIIFFLAPSFPTCFSSLL
jgi:hypothetical protein